MGILLYFSVMDYWLLKRLNTIVIWYTGQLYMIIICQAINK